MRVVAIDEPVSVIVFVVVTNLGLTDEGVCTLRVFAIDEPVSVIVLVVCTIFRNTGLDVGALRVVAVDEPISIIVYFICTIFGLTIKLTFGVITIGEPVFVVVDIVKALRTIKKDISGRFDDKTIIEVGNIGYAADRIASLAISIARDARDVFDPVAYDKCGPSGVALTCGYMVDIIIEIYQTASEIII